MWVSALLARCRYAVVEGGTVLTDPFHKRHVKVTAILSSSASINSSVASALASYGPTVDSLRGVAGGLNSTAATISTTGTTANAYIPQVLAWGRACERKNMS